MKKVIIRKCDSYNKKEIISIVKESIDKLGLKERIKGKIVIKPNVVLAHKKVAPSAFTRPEIIDSLITSIKSIGEEDLSFTRENGFKRVDSLDGSVKVFAGEPYCFGGCHGVFLDWIYMLKDRAPQRFEKKKDIAVVIGEFSGDIMAKKVIILGDCSKVNGKIEAKRTSRIKGCPTRHKDLILHLFLKAGIRAPLLRPDILLDAYLSFSGAILRVGLKI